MGAFISWLQAASFAIQSVLYAIRDEWLHMFIAIGLALLLSFVGSCLKDRAVITAHDAVVRVYEGGRLRDEKKIDLPPELCLAAVGVVIRKRCECGCEDNDSVQSTPPVIQEPHKDEL